MPQTSSVAFAERRDLVALRLELCWTIYFWQDAVQVAPYTVNPFLAEIRACRMDQGVTGGRERGSPVLFWQWQHEIF